MQNNDNPMQGGEKELNLYVYCVQPGPNYIEVKEDVRLCVASSEQESFDLCRKMYPAGALIKIDPKGSIPVSKMLAACGTVPAPQEPTIEKAETPVSSFICGLMLVADRYVKSAKDRKELKRIVASVDAHYGKELSEKGKD